MNAIVFVVMLLALYGPKIGVLDLSIAGGMLGLLSVLLRRRLVVPGEYVTLLAMCIALAGYAMVVTIASGSDDFFMVLRQIRATISLALLGIVFFNTEVRPESLLKLLILALFVHVAAIAIQIGAPSTQDLFAAIWLFDKGTRPFRAFGLTAGYNTSGFLALMGAILCLVSMLYISKSKARYLLGFYVFCVAALFTSRTTMLLAVLLVAAVSFMLVLKGNWWVKAVGITFLSVGAYYGATIAFPLVVASVPSLEAWFEPDDDSANEFNTTYSRGTVDALTSSFWFAPPDLASLVFGTGVDPATDIGYVKLLNMVGAIGLFLAIGPYLYLLRMGLRLHAHAKNLPADSTRWATEALALALVAIIGVTFIANLKGSYLFTRAFHELNVIIVFTLLAAVRKGRRADSGAAWVAS